MSTHETHDLHTLTGAYATDALPDDERADFEQHLAECATCRREIDGLLATAARLGSAVAAAAPPAMRARVLAEIATVRQASPVATRQASPRRDDPWFRQPLGIAASLLLVVAMGLAAFAVTERQRANRAEDTAARIAAVATDPDRTELTRPVSSGGAGMVILADGHAVFRARGLHSLPADRTYQLWVINDDGARSAGVLGRADGGSVARFVEHVHADDTIGLTIEPDGGSDQPSTDPVLLLPLSG
jgi:anti-sigma-K factor RskA